MFAEFLHKDLRPESIHLRRQFPSQLLDTIRITDQRENLRDGLFVALKVKLLVPDNLPGASRAWDDRDAAHRCHFRDCDPEGLDPAGVKSERLAREDLLFSLEGEKSLGLDPIDPIHHPGNFLCVGRIIEAADQSKSRGNPILTYRLDDLDDTLDLLLRNDTPQADESEGIPNRFFLRPGKNHRRIDHGRTGNTELGFEMRPAPFRVCENEIPSLAKGERIDSDDLGKPEVEPSQRRFPVMKAPVDMRVEQLTHLLAEAEIPDQLNPRRSKVDGVVGTDTEVKALCPRSAEALEQSQLCLNELERAVHRRQPRSTYQSNSIRVYGTPIGIIEFIPIHGGSRDEGDLVVVLQGLQRPHRGGFGPTASHPGMCDQDRRFAHDFTIDPEAGELSGSATRLVGSQMLFFPPLSKETKPANIAAFIA